MIPLKLKVTAVAGVVLLTGCSLTGNNDAIETEVQTNGFYGMQLIVTRCSNDLLMDSQGLSATGIALAETAASATIDWLSKAIKESLKDDVTETVATRNIFSFDDIATKGACLQVVRGKFQFSKPLSTQTPYTYTSFSGVKTTDGVPAYTHVGATMFMAPEDEELFIEVKPIINGNYLTFTPLEIRYAGITPTDRDKPKARDVALNIGFATPDSEILGSSMPSRLVSFGKVSPDGEGKPSTTKFVYGGKPTYVGETQWQKVDQKILQSPVTLVAKVIETKRVNQLAKFLREVYSERSEGLESMAIEKFKQLDFMQKSDVVAKQQAEMATQVLEEQTKYLKLIQTAEQAKESLLEKCEAENPVVSVIMAAQIELFSAQQTANIAAELAGKEQPYSNLSATDGVCVG